MNLPWRINTNKSTSHNKRYELVRCPKICVSEQLIRDLRSICGLDVWPELYNIINEESRLYTDEPLSEQEWTDLYGLYIGK